MILSNYYVIKEAHNNPELDKRTDNLVFNLIYFDSVIQKGIIFNYSGVWKTLRKFTLKTLRDLGVGKSNLQDGILEECQSLVDFFQEVGSCRKEVHLSTIFNKVALNVTWKIIAGERYAYDDERLDRLITMFDKFMKFGQSLVSGPLGLLPFLRHVPPFKANFLEFRSNLEELRGFLKEIIIDHKKTFDRENLRDYIDAFINEAEITNDPTFSDEQLLFCFLDLFNGGTETTSKSLMFFIAYMILYPDIQDKVAEEILAAIPDEQVRMEDKEALPLTTAVITEIWRLHPVIPHDPMRETMKDVTIGGYDIPAKTEIISNYFAAHMDEEIWKEPTHFKPERHLGRKENLLIFGAGRRKCLGESLARPENFLIFSNLVKHFKFECPEGEKPNLDGVLGLIVGPLPFTVILTPREID